MKGQRPERGTTLTFRAIFTQMVLVGKRGLFEAEKLSNSFESFGRREAGTGIQSMSETQSR